jgi:hypothetical protein
MTFCNEILDRDCDYDGIDAVNISRLLLLRTSPLHFRAAQKRITKPMSLGTAAHCATLEPDRFGERFAMWVGTHPEGAKDSKGKDCSGKKRIRSGKEWEAFEAGCEIMGQTVLTESEHKDALAIAQAVHSDPLAHSFLEFGKPERVLTWTDKRTGIACKGRTDWDYQAPRLELIVDLKTAADVTPFRFLSAAARLGYHVRMAWYADGYQAITGRFPRVMVIAVESAPPHDVVCYELDDEVLAIGREEYGRLLDTLVDCRRSGQWPGIGGGTLQRFALPKWAQPSEESDTEETYAFTEDV